ncbi:hypothetical protein GGQ84_002557 [Desulfitispora alkaliphila]|uniref:hypothetical protein n=1 Tax=Desulfitispora alkaliphila TaxID=622674 RepID=UPI003D21A3F0
MSTVIQGNFNYGATEGNLATTTEGYFYEQQITYELKSDKGTVDKMLNATPEEIRSLLLIRRYDSATIKLILKCIVNLKYYQSCLDAFHTLDGSSKENNYYNYCYGKFLAYHKVATELLQK